MGPPVGYRRGQRRRGAAGDCGTEQTGMDGARRAMECDYAAGSKAARRAAARVGVA